MKRLRTGLVTAAVVGLAMFAGWPAARAESMAFNALHGDVTVPSGESRPAPPPPPPPAVEPCAATIDEHDGVVTLEVVDAARSGQTSTVTLDGNNYTGAFGDDGRMRLDAPLLHNTGDLLWTGRNGVACERPSLRFANYETAFFFALVWTGSFELALHVQQEDGTWLPPEQPGDMSSHPLGVLRRFGGSAPGSTQVWLYSVARGAVRIADGSTWAFVDFVSRGNPARPPFCGGGRLSSPRFDLVSHKGGFSTQVRNMGSAPVACGFAWPDAASSWLRLRF